MEAIMTDDAARTAARQVLRARVRALRTEQSPEQALEKSVQAQRVLMASPLWTEARSVAVYAATRGECSTELLARTARAEGKTLWFPRVRRGEKGVMDFVEIRDRRELVPGRFGIFEPDSALPGVRASDFACDLAVIPGLVFALSGARLGFGGGYYDRYFGTARVLARVGLCFSFQLVPSLDTEPWDVAMTHLCSEEGLVAARSM